MSERRNRKNGAIILVSGILLSVLFIALGYWLTAIIGLMIDKSVDFLTGFCMVLDNPFDKYFNDFTPVGIVLGFIIAEALFFFLIVRNRKSEDILDENEYAPDVIDIANEAGMDYTDSKKNSQVADKELFAKASVKKTEELGDIDYIQPDVGVNEETKNEKDINEEQEKEQEELSFDDAVVTDLLNDYDLSQIAAMLQIKKYIEINDVTLLRKMFKPQMVASDITSYIEMFYE